MKLGAKYSWTEISVLNNNWQKLALDNGGKSKTISVGGGVYERFELKIPFSESVIEISTDEYKPLKIKYSFKKPLDLEFLIYPEDFMDQISKLFGNKEIVIGDELFDHKYFIKGNQELRIKKMLNSNFRAYLLENFVSNFKLEKIDHVNVLELNLTINELDYSSMSRLMNLFMECIIAISDEN